MNLIDEAKEEGIEKVLVAALVRNDAGKILLVEEQLTGEPIYRLPVAVLQAGETTGQALQRGIMEDTTMELSNVVSYIGHYDIGKERTLHFVVEVKDPYSMEANSKMAFAWLETTEAVGYPIRDELRAILDTYAKS